MTDKYFNFIFQRYGFKLFVLASGLNLQNLQFAIALAFLKYRLN